MLVIPASGLETLQALAALLNAGVAPVCRSWVRSVPVAISRRCRTSPSCCSGVAERFIRTNVCRARSLASRRTRARDLVVQGRARAQQRHRADARDRRAGAGRLQELLDTADLAAAMAIEAFAGRRRFRAGSARPATTSGQVAAAAHVRILLDGSTLADVAYHLVPKFRPCSGSGKMSLPAGAALSPGLGLGAAGAAPRAREFYRRFLPAGERPAGGQRSLRCAAGAWRCARPRGGAGGWRSS